MRFEQTSQPGGADDKESALRSAREVERLSRQLAGVPIVQGALLKDVVITGGGVSVPHKLGRKIQGWLAVRWPQGALIEEQSTQTDLSRFIDLQVQNKTALVSAGQLSAWDNSTAQFTTTNTVDRLDVDTDNAQVWSPFPGPDGAQVLSVDIYGQNPASNVRSFDAITLETSAAPNSSLATTVASFTVPTTSTSTTWTASIDTTTAGMPHTYDATGKLAVVLDADASGSTEVLVHAVKWTYALAATATCDLWVF